MSEGLTRAEFLHRLWLVGVVFFVAVCLLAACAAAPAPSCSEDPSCKVA